MDLAATLRARSRKRPGWLERTSSSQPGWCAVFAGPRIALMQVLQARASAADLRARVLDHITREASPNWPMFVSFAAGRISIR